MSKALNQTGAIPGSCRDVERCRKSGLKNRTGQILFPTNHQPGITSPLKRRRFQFQMSRPYNFDLRKNATATHIIVNIWVMSMSFDVFETTTSSSKYRRDSLFSPRHQQKHATLLKIFSFPSLKFTHHSHNHRSQNGCISNRMVTFQISRHFPLNHDYGRKSTPLKIKTTL